MTVVDVAAPSTGRTGAVRRDGVRRSRPLRSQLTSMTRYVVLAIYALVAIGPILLIVVNSLKTQRAIFDDPLSLPSADTFTLDGYRTVLEGNFLRTLVNSLLVTSGSVVAVLAVGSMAAFALARYTFIGRGLITLFLAIGIFLPTTLGSVVVLRIFSELGLVNNLVSLVLIYTAQSTPLAVFILTAFFREVPKEILDAARVDGAGEFRIYRLSLPLVRPALAAVAVLTMIPVWNDIWWPLILAPARDSQTLILGTQTFVGVYDTDWNALLSALTMAMIPVLATFAFFSKQLIRGITSGALK